MAEKEVATEVVLPCATIKLDGFSHDDTGENDPRVPALPAPKLLLEGVPEMGANGVGGLLEKSENLGEPPNCDVPLFGVGRERYDINDDDDDEPP